MESPEEYKDPENAQMVAFLARQLYIHSIGNFEMDYYMTPEKVFSLAEEFIKYEMMYLVKHSNFKL